MNTGHQTSFLLFNYEEFYKNNKKLSTWTSENACLNILPQTFNIHIGFV